VARAPALQMASDAIPHGGKLVNTMLKDEAAKQAAIKACSFSMELDERQLCDVELLMQGGFSPLTGFMDEADYKSVVEDLKLTNGLIFGLPVVYDTNDPRVVPGTKVLLTYKGVNIATLDVTSRYVPNKPVEAKKCYGTSSIEHPAVLMITTERGKYYCGGAVTGLNVPTREFPCKSPEEVRAKRPLPSCPRNSSLHCLHLKPWSRRTAPPFFALSLVARRCAPSCLPARTSRRSSAATPSTR
jgi:sulfate adenylyltransferase